MKILTIPTGSKIPVPPENIMLSTDDALRHLAFDNSLQANIIFSVSDGKIVMFNNAACKLLGYSHEDMLTKTRSDIFDVHDINFIKMLKQREAHWYSRALVTVIKKSGKPFTCEITSAIFISVNGIKKSITTITDMSRNIMAQKKTDNRKDKRVAKNIVEALAKSDARLVKNKEWIKHIAQTSYDVMWDWDITTGSIYVGDSVYEIFGYELRNNTVNFKNFIQCIIPEQRDIIEDNLLKTLNSGKKSWTDSYKIKRRDGTIASVTSRAAIVRNKEGIAIRLIGAIQDGSKLEELEHKLKEQIAIQEDFTKIFLVTAKLSFDVIWDWNLATDEVFIGEGYKELFGYVIKDNTGNMIADWTNYLHPDDKKTVKTGLRKAIASSATHWQHTYRFIRANGSIAKVFNRVNIIRHPDGKAYRVIGAMQDISRQTGLEDRLEQEIATNGELLSKYNKSFKLIFDSSHDVLFDSDLINNKVIISDAYEKEFGYKITGGMTPAEDWMNHIHPEDKEDVIKDYTRMLASKDIEWKYSYRFLRADNSVANVLSSRIILRDADGKAYRMMGYMQDISKQKVLEEKLDYEIRQKEKQIAEATEEAKETERSDIGKELHDNVNQLLGASKLYLDMAKRGGDNTELYLSRSSQYTFTAIEEIRKLTKGLTTDTIQNLGICEAIYNISREMMEVNPAVKIILRTKSFVEDSIDNKFKLNVFRIVQEHLNNILKHAKATEIIIDLSCTKKSIILWISDNGIGFDTLQKNKGIGLENIKSRAATYKGKADFVSQPGEGCVMTVTFPVVACLSLT